MVMTKHLFQASAVSSKLSGVKQFLHERPLSLSYPLGPCNLLRYLELCDIQIEYSLGFVSMH